MTIQPLEENTSISSDLSEEELEERNETSENLEAVRYAIQSYDVDGLVRRLQNNDIIIPSFSKSNEELDVHGFQRNFVWTKAQMDAFIESILMKYPTQGLFLVEQEDDSYLVLDGQQRLLTVRYFQEGFYPITKSDGTIEKREFILRNVSEDFKDLSYSVLKEKNQKLRRTFDNYSFSATVIRTQPNKGNKRAIYQIFERINSKGTLLTAHEIRIATYAGKLVQFIAEINENNSSWRKLYGNPDKRLRDHEMISRIFAMYLTWEDYKPPFKEFINNFFNLFQLELKESTELIDGELVRDSEEKREERENKIMHTKDLFEKSCEILSNAKEDALRPYGPLNAAWVDAVFVGLMNRLDSHPISTEAVNQCLLTLLDSVSQETDGKMKFTAPEYGKHASQSAYVSQRISHAIEVFRNA